MWKGFVLKQIVKAQGMKTTLEVTKLKLNTSIDSDLFEIPNGYTETKNPMNDILKNMNNAMAKQKLEEDKRNEAKRQNREENRVEEDSVEEDNEKSKSDDDTDEDIDKAVDLFKSLFQIEIFFTRILSKI